MVILVGWMSEEQGLIPGWGEVYFLLTKTLKLSL
jgi:hypothetical protein